MENRKKIVFEEVGGELISFRDVNQSKPIFATKDGKLAGMVVNEKDCDEDGWILRLGGNRGSSSYHETLEECLTNGLKFGYEYFVVDDSPMDKPIWKRYGSPCFGIGMLKSA